jgi:hypothetical protein
MPVSTLGAAAVRYPDLVTKEMDPVVTAQTEQQAYLFLSF